MGVYTNEEQLELIHLDPCNLAKIDNQYEEICLEAVKENGYAIEYINYQTHEICLIAVKQFGATLEYIKNQTPEICLAAVRQNGQALKYVKEQTYELSLEAVKQNGHALRYVKEETEEICLEAVKRDGAVLRFVKDKTPEICFYAFLNYYKLLDYNEIEHDLEKFTKENPTIINQVFIINKYKHLNNNYNYFDVNSLNYLKNYLLKQKNNKYILDDNIEIDILKEISLSNNELILIDTGYIKDIHRMLANKIIKKEDLIKESF